MFSDMGYQKKNSFNVIVCPSYLVEKWQRELETYYPKAVAKIVDSFDAFCDLESYINDPKRNRHLFVIMSKETAKFGYEERPAAVWRPHVEYRPLIKKAKLRGMAFHCPDCGQVLMAPKRITVNGKSETIDVPMEMDAFRTQVKANRRCSNMVKRFDFHTGKHVEEECGAPLWAPIVRQNQVTSSSEFGPVFRTNNAVHQWMRLPKCGWVREDHINAEIERLKDDAIKDVKIDTNYLAALADAKAKLSTGKPSIKAPRKYPLAQYIKERYKGKLDYLTLDEIHELKGGDTEQGQAFGQLASAARKVMGLTGTLVNGYANGIFYILYRLFPAQMQREGFRWTDEKLFQEEYGVTEFIQGWKYTNANSLSKTRQSINALPGVSPLVFTQFLLENAVFVELSDMAEGLPGYREIPVPVEMDDDLKIAYTRFQDEFKSAVTDTGGRKIMGKLYQSLSTYPDQPYGNMPIIHPDSGKVVVTPTNLPDVERNKEKKLFELVHDRIADGEKVLLYFNWTHSTDCMQKTYDRLIAEGVKAVMLTPETYGANARNREAWINRQVANGAQVMLTNPELVKTGLDLIAFTSIIFYQLGNNLYTMRQASRRSWRLSQENDVKVYFMFYKGTVQENATSLMATKLQAAMSAEGKFSEEGLQAMSNNEDFLTQVANSVVNGALYNVDEHVFDKTSVAGGKKIRKKREVYKSSIRMSEYSPWSKAKLKKSIGPILATGLMDRYSQKLEFTA